MEKFYSGIVKHRKLIIVLFAVLFIVCMILQNIVEVNYDINDYLPEDCKSTISIDVMEEEFDGGIPNARVMVYDVTVPQARFFSLPYRSTTLFFSFTGLKSAEK